MRLKIKIIYRALFTPEPKIMLKLLQGANMFRRPTWMKAAIFILKKRSNG